MNIERLRGVIRALQESTDSELNMSEWRLGECSCAIGLFCKRNPDSVLTLEEGRISLVPRYSVFSNWFAVELFFEITHNEAESLFSEWYYPGHVTLEMVIARIQSFITSPIVGPIIGEL